jgi:hypothetical protein
MGRTVVNEELDLLNQIPIRVSHINAPQLPSCSNSLYHYSPFQNLYPFAFESRQDIINGMLCKKALPQLVSKEP